MKLQRNEFVYYVACCKPPEDQYWNPNRYKTPIHSGYMYVCICVYCVFVYIVVALTYSHKLYKSAWLS